jgi:DNA-binding transcriptional ArsR family regulator
MLRPIITGLPRHSTKQLTVTLHAPTFNSMVEFQDTGLDAVFHALGDATRRRMLRSLTQGERTVGQLAEPFQMSLAAASKHVKALEGAGLIRREIRGRLHICRLEATPLAAANDWLRFYERFWTARLDRLEDLLRQDTQRAAATAASPSPTQRTARRAAPHPPRAKPKRSTR